MFSSGFFFQAEDGIRDLVRSRGLGDVYKRQVAARAHVLRAGAPRARLVRGPPGLPVVPRRSDRGCLLYTSDAADERSSVDLGGRRILKKKKVLTNPHKSHSIHRHRQHKIPTITQ